MRRASGLLVILILTLSLPGIASALGFESVMIELSESWTGNGYVPPEFDVTGSESFPLDPMVGFAIRLGLMDGFTAQNAVLSLMPGVELGLRRYLLYESGIVVPTQVETAAGDESGTPGVGSASVLTIRIPVPVAYEYRFTNATALYMSLSPTIVGRIRVGGIAPDESADLGGMYTFFYERLRFLMPEIALGFRFPVSEFLESTIRASFGVSVLDLLDTSLPWYDKTRAAITVSLGARPPFSGLFRDREETQQLPRGVEERPETDS